MFCADWALGLTVWYFLARAHPPLASPSEKGGHPALTVAAAAGSGAVAMAALHPFDFVRNSTPSFKAKSFMGSLPLSTVAFTTFAFGTYWSNRDSTDKLSRLKWSLLSSFAGAAAELPLDRAKVEMAGGMGRAALLAGTRVPLGAMMLFAVDWAIVGEPGREREVWAREKT